MRPQQTGTTNGPTPSAADRAGSLPAALKVRSTRRRWPRVIDILSPPMSDLRRGQRAHEAESGERRAERARVRATGEQVEVRLPIDAQAPGAARIFVTHYLRDRVAAPVLDSAVLLVSELATNSVRHSDAPAGASVRVRINITRAHLWLGVEDPGHDGAIAARPPDRQTGHGFGLNIVHTLSERWGVDRSPHNGTRVWAQLARTTATAPQP